MSDLAAALARLKEDLQALAVRWAVIGGLAVSVRAEPRTTLDVDVIVVVGDDAQAEATVRQLIGRGYRFTDEGVFEQRAAHRLATVRLAAPPRESSIVVDVMFASSGIESEIVAGSERMEVFSDVFVPVASRGHLIAMKVLAGRPQDKADVFALMRLAEVSDLDSARRALRLIERRGFHRGRPLIDILARWERELEEERSGPIQPR